MKCEKCGTDTTLGDNYGFFYGKILPQTKGQKGPSHEIHKALPVYLCDKDLSEAIASPYKPIGLLMIVAAIAVVALAIVARGGGYWGIGLVVAAVSALAGVFFVSSQMAKAHAGATKQMRNVGSQYPQARKTGDKMAIELKKPEIQGSGYNLFYTRDEFQTKFPKEYQQATLDTDSLVKDQSFLAQSLHARTNSVATTTQTVQTVSSQIDHADQTAPSPKVAASEVVTAQSVQPIQANATQVPIQITADSMICSNCLTIARSEGIGKALLRAAGLVLIVPAIVVVFSVFAGDRVIGQNSLFLGIGFLATIYAAFQTVQQAMSRACPNCKNAPMTRIASSEGILLQEKLLHKQSDAYSAKEIISDKNEK